MNVFSNLRAIALVIDQYVVVTVRWILVMLLTLMSIVIFANVALRYLSGSSIVWAEEVARYAMVWLTFLGMGAVFRIGGHIAIENLQDAVPPSVAKLLRAVILAAIILLGLGMVQMGLVYMGRSQFQMTASTQIPFSYVYAAVPVGGALLVWSAIATGLNYVSKRKFEVDSTSDAHLEGVQI
jgi:TRAP-type transport system small permease protein